MSLAALVFAGPASAGTPAITYTHITGVTDPAHTFGNPFFTAYDSMLGSEDPSNSLTITGTSDDTTGQDLYVYCVYGESGGGTDYNQLGTIYAENSSEDPSHINQETGDFTAVISKSAFEDTNSDPARHCLILVLPEWVNPNAAPASFTGPRADVGWMETFSYDNTPPSTEAVAAVATRRPATRRPSRSTGSTGNTMYDYWFAFGGFKGGFEYDSIGSCGIEGSWPVFPNGSETGNKMWDCAAAVYAWDYTGTRSEMQIDGVDAYTSYYAYYWSDCSGSCTDPAGITVTVDGPDPSTGNVTIHESQDIVKYAAPIVVDGVRQKGGDLISTGVRLERTISQDHQGLLSTVSDRYISTDGQTHSVDVQYDNYSGQDDPQWKFPGQDTFNTYGEGDMVDLPAQSTGTVYVGDFVYADGSYENPQGAITYNTAPNRALFSGSEEMILNYVRSVPAGGSTTITQAYSQGANSAVVANLAKGAEDSFGGPSVSITSPASGATVATAAQTITGTASDNVGVSSLTVNGISVAVAADGTWSRAITLNQGANVITAIATDGAGNTAQAQETINFVAPTVAASKAKAKCKVPSLRGRTLRGAKRAIVRSNCAIGKITTAKSKKIKVGHVVRQGRRAGAQLPNGTKVNLVLSKPAAKKHKKH